MLSTIWRQRLKCLTKKFLNDMCLYTLCFPAGIVLVFYLWIFHPFHFLISLLFSQFLSNCILLFLWNSSKAFNFIHISKISKFCCSSATEVLCLFLFYLTRVAKVRWGISTIWVQQPIRTECCVKFKNILTLIFGIKVLYVFNPPIEKSVLYISFLLSMHTSWKTPDIMKIK
jgi:hypothetical protein